MAQIVVKDDTKSIHLNPEMDPMGEVGYDGQCPACGWTVKNAHGYAPGLEDAVQSTEIHLDLQCPHRELPAEGITPDFKPAS